MNYFTIAGLIGGQELIIIAIIVLLLFGGRKIPELMKGLGQGVRNFKEGKDGVDEVRQDGYQRPYDNMNANGQYNNNAGGEYRNAGAPGYDNRPDARYNTGQGPYTPPADNYNQNPPRG